MKDTAQQEALFDQTLAALGIEPTAHDRQRLWTSYLKQQELAAAWTGRLDPAAEPALEFRATGESP
ncbi:hypothetical protein [Lutibaculum baratangense]|uniref:Uncharacterized protein n=1 Tax=Lutibaculum baratangense AMV1 TaxID=631454 RepID=V4R022_9HYPH|nr:hypothetical protein [Lutibaculum baratangense]ESR25357.1 hypothetical protein N177_1874 [Lutibaculum baratangense AMV1]